MSRYILGTDTNAGRGGRWDIRSYGGPAIRNGSEFEVVDMVIILDPILGRRPGSYHVNLGSTRGQQEAVSGKQL